MMGVWVFVINGEMVITFAQTKNEALDHLQSEYDVTSEMCIGSVFPAYNYIIPSNAKICYPGISPTDTMIVSGLLKAFASAALYKEKHGD